MKYSETSIGRIFVIRYEDGDKLPDMVQDFARDKGIKSGFCIFLGGIKNRSELVVGPETDEGMPPVPMHLLLSGTHEVLGVGTLFPDETGNPILHSHAAMGRKDGTVTGCIRPGIYTWNVLEMILLEFNTPCGIRVYDEKTQFKLLKPDS